VLEFIFGEQNVLTGKCFAANETKIKTFHWMEV